MEPSTYQYRVLVKYGKLVNKYYVAMTLRFTVMCIGAVKQNQSKYYKKFKQN